jgi:DnaD/phage-associated family protein
MSEKITAWCNYLSDELVIEYMKFAVERGSKTWAYVEAILRDWVDKQYKPFLMFMQLENGTKSKS